VATFKAVVVPLTISMLIESPLAIIRVVESPLAVAMPIVVSMTSRKIGTPLTTMMSMSGIITPWSKCAQQ
jgi:hypothetical protein